MRFQASKLQASKLDEWRQSLARKERRASSFCCSTSGRGQVDSATEDASAEEDGDGADQVSQLSAEEVDKRLRKAAAFIATADSLAPYDRRTFNAALVIW